MKTLKKVLLVIAGIVILLLVIALFSEKEYAVEKSIVINRPNEEVFDYIKYLKNQDNYSRWASIDPDMKKTYSGTDATPGFVSAWESDNDDVGKGEQEIKRMDEGKRIDYEIRFMEPMSSTSDAYMTTTPVDSNQTKVSWGFTGKMNYPTNIILVFMDMEEMVGEDFSTGLSNLKAILEK